ncbi:MAG TPA: hypothetical protein VIM37_04275 [Candidatus Microsaccharimonas sp.]|jgi:hypothetical protein
MSYKNNLSRLAVLKAAEDAKDKKQILEAAVDVQVKKQMIRYGLILWIVAGIIGVGVCVSIGVMILHANEGLNIDQERPLIAVLPFMNFAMLGLIAFIAGTIHQRIYKALVAKASVALKE